ncbi:MAG: AAA family ATPase [Polyangiaceae bacterium]|nr:AAA family ATPase [Polyangiaceae bacterium]
MRKAVQDILNRYFAAELGRQNLLPDMERIQRQRAAFLDRFGPERLAKMSGSELLREIPYSDSNESPMADWLAQKNDGEFCSRWFGVLAPNDEGDMPVWQTEHGVWRAQVHESKGVEKTGPKGATSELEEIRRRILAAVETVKTFDKAEARAVEPTVFQAAVRDAAGPFIKDVWLHKYLHMVCPNCVTCYIDAFDFEKSLYGIGEIPVGDGLYELDIQVIRFWNSLSALADLPVEARYRLGWDLDIGDCGDVSHWCIDLQGDVETWRTMIDTGQLSLGLPHIGGLHDAAKEVDPETTKKKIESRLRKLRVDHKPIVVANLVDLVHAVAAENHVALLSSPSEVVAVGVVTGGYRFREGVARPHYVPVRWRHNRPFRISEPIQGIGEQLLAIKRPSLIVADIEASLIENGIGPDAWYNFESYAPEPPLQLSSPIARREVEPPTQTAKPLPPLQGLAREVSEMLERKRQVILYGPPGTGKTHHAERIAREIVARHNYNCLPADLTKEKRAAVDGRFAKQDFVETCTFHPMYSYEDFIEGYRPKGIEFALEPGIFKRIATAAHKQPDKRFILIIDEINRGNIPKIFGELITLIETSKRGKTSVILPLSKESFTVPDNLYILGTMNTADRSILLLDTALRRRFAFKELMPEPDLLRNGCRVDGIPLSTWLRALNRRIVEQLGRDGRNLQVGHAYFMPGGKPVSTVQRMGEIVRDEIWPLLQEYCYEDPNKLAKILGSGKRCLYDGSTGTLRFELFDPKREEDLARSLASMVTDDDRLDDADFAEDMLGDDTEESQDTEETEE